MSRNLFTRMASVILAFGLFFGCSSPNPFVEDTKTFIDDGNLRLALQTINRGVNQEPENPEIHYFKGLVHHKMAQTETNAANKHQHYQQMGTSFRTVLRIYEEEGTRGRRSREIEYLRTSSWAEEHNRGVSILGDENRRSLNHIRTAVDHLRNATAILPDSTLSHELLAEAYLRLNDTAQAYSVLNEALRFANKKQADRLHERLAYLALKTGDYDGARKAFENLSEEQRSNTNLAHGLINIYQRNMEHQKALALARQLRTRYPDKLAYEYVIGAQAHQLSMRRYEQWLEGYQAEEFTQFSEHNLIREARAFELESLTAYRAIMEQEDDIDLRGLVGIVHQNYFLIKEAIAAALADEEEQNLLNEESGYHKENALTLLIEASEGSDEPFRYWEALILIYNHLGDTEQAENYIRLMESAL